MHVILKLHFSVRSSLAGALRTSNYDMSDLAMLLLRNLIMAWCFAFLEVACRPGTHTKKCIHSTPIDLFPTQVYQ